MTGPETVELPDVVAFLLCHIRGEEETCRELLNATDGVKLLGYAIEVAVEVASRSLPGGRGELERMLTSWQARRNGSMM